MKGPIGPTAPEYGLPAVALDATAAAPLHRQLYEALRRDMLAGRLRPGQRLPATRPFADELGVSRNTVVMAFEQLRSEGYVAGRVGAGTFVTDALPEAALHVAATDAAAAPAQGAAAGLSRRGRRILETPATSPVHPAGVVAFRPGVPALDAFPFGLWARLTARQLRQLPSEAYAYGAPAGYPPLREAVAAYVRTARGVRCEAEQVVIVGGAQQGLDLVARVLLDPGDTAWIEDPGYLGTRAALTAAGVRLQPVPVDADGLVVAEGARLAPEARLVCTTPSYQYPGGVTMSLARRLDLLAWAARHGAWVLEDDYDSEYRYAGPPLAALQALDQSGQVLYLGTFSKVLFPALRLGYLIAPPALVDAFVAARAAADRQGSVLEQAVVAAFITEGHFSRHIRKMRVRYQARQACLVAEARRLLAGRLDVRPADAGLHLVGVLNDRADDTRVAARAAAAGLATPPLSHYRLQHPAPPALILGYPAFPEDAIRKGVERLARVLEEAG